MSLFYKSKIWFKFKVKKVERPINIHSKKLNIVDKLKESNGFF